MNMKMLSHNTHLSSVILLLAIRFLLHLVQYDTTYSNPKKISLYLWKFCKTGLTDKPPFTYQRHPVTRSSRDFSSSNGNT